jgi:hypothetical protein
MNREVKTLVRARYQNEVERLLKMGADHVIYEELESAFRFVTETFEALGQETRLIKAALNELRTSKTEGLPDLSRLDPHNQLGRMTLPGSSQIEWIELQSDSPLIGQTIAQANIRHRTGVNVISIMDGETQLQEKPSPERMFRANDILVVVGNSQELAALESLLSVHP